MTPTVENTEVSPGEVKYPPVENIPILLNSMSRSGSPGFDDLEGFSLSERALSRWRIVSEVLNIPKESMKDKPIQIIAQKHGVTRQTVHRLVKKYNKYGLPGLSDTRSTKGVARAWTPEALDYWCGLFLKRAHRKISMKGLYKVLETEARRMGWKMGSYRNACYQISKIITPQLLSLRNGGARALDNSLPSILRDYSDLQPFEILVGDQHRFDFWVVDEGTGEIFRPECYLWQDLRTRIIYGGAVARRYNSHLMALALRIGVHYFGLFRNIYTDNGKSELSRYIQDILQDVKGYPLSVYETIDVPLDLSNADDETVRCDIETGKHIKAIVQNAKAKMIEGTNCNLERIFRDDLLLPGYVKRLTDEKEKQDVDEGELKHLAEAGRLPTSKEFGFAFYKALNIYNLKRPHRGVRREWIWQPRPSNPTPKDCLKMCVRDGWRSTYLPDETIDLLFLPKAARQPVISRGRLRFQNEYYENTKLLKLHGKKVSIRFDPMDLRYVLVFQGDTYLCRAEAIEYSSMRDKELAARKIAEKAWLNKTVRAEYHEFTEGIQDVRQFSEVPKIEKEAALVGKEKRRKARENNNLYGLKTKEELAQEMALIEDNARSLEAKAHDEKDSNKRPEFFLTKWARYEWVSKQELSGEQLSDEDVEFKSGYEEKLSEEEKEDLRTRFQWEVNGCSRNAF